MVRLPKTNVKCFRPFFLFCVQQKKNCHLFLSLTFISLVDWGSKRKFLKNHFCFDSITTTITWISYHVCNNNSYFLRFLACNLIRGSFCLNGLNVCVCFSTPINAKKKKGHIESTRQKSTVETKNTKSIILITNF